MKLRPMAFWSSPVGWKATTGVPRRRTTSASNPSWARLASRTKTFPADQPGQQSPGSSGVRSATWGR